MSKYMQLSLIIVLIFLLLALLFLKNYCKLIGYLKIGSIVDSSNNITDRLELGDDTDINTDDSISGGTNDSNDKTKPKKIYTDFTKEDIEELTFSNVT